MKKNYYLLLLLMLFFYISPLEAKHLFIRIFDQHGYMIAKGNLFTTTDSSIQLRRGKVPVEIYVRDIGTIKTKRSFGHPILIGGIVGTLSGAITGLAAHESLNSGSDYFDLETSVGEDMAAVALVGAAVGGLIGTIVAATQKRTVLTINGDMNEWQQQKKVLDAMQTKLMEERGLK
ncbi:hypothetical protein [Chitinophaga pinensis]|uniref:Uncharacterized protein n=1 Tax=Chitinophaga pinensis (strain ATCC 43595 / DSM 2588 / LMG 13176 / NBRC 15968 / NCIMB 11800 / UQM 2034) TaxID=485918 RepID=A0A979G8G3_CHIPD|nr:hypothetical protein [Chitinophaga pinensis]ACU62597.1 hypothetical protein Cpin_5166 [Chitinophaga pinensis DSM 2588]